MRSCLRLLAMASITTSATIAICSTIPAIAAAQNVDDTRLLSQPAISRTHVAFAYAGDLWSARMDGSDVRRLTTAEGDETSPVFSPDGSMIAFSGNYDGNLDVYLIPVGGGSPRRLTHHPAPDNAQGFTPDGKRVLFASGRNGSTTKLSQLYTVSVEGGGADQLPIPSAFQGTFSPSGDRIAYNPLPRAFDQWKRYRGGRTSQIWLYTSGAQAVEKIPQPATRSNDVDAMWSGDVVYFRSDRDGEFNIYAYDVKTRQTRQLTRHTDFPVLAASAGGGKIIYEQAGFLHLLDPAAGQTRRLALGVATDLRETRPRWVSGNQYVRNASISPTGVRVALEYRGEIVTVPAEKGDARNLTNSPGANDRSPAWSPDGSRIAWFSDDGGEYRLHIAPQDGKGQHKVFNPGGAGFYREPQWSPDNSHIAYIDNSQSIYIIDIASGTTRKVGGNRVYTPNPMVSGAWSPDSKWYAYVVGTNALTTALFAYNVDDNSNRGITDGLSAVTSPAFDRSGKYLYMLASTDAGPALDWFAQSNTSLPNTGSIYAIVLRKDIPNPVARESDEEKTTADGSTPPPAPQMNTANAPPASTDPVVPPRRAPAAAVTRIDFDGIEQRIVALPVPTAALSDVQAGEAGMIFYIRETDGTSVLHRYDLNKRRDETFLPNVNVGGYAISADGKKILWATDAGAWSVAPTAAPNPSAPLRLATATVEVRIDPRAEWQQIFDEAWRINRDYFYAPNMHGVDWSAAKKKYEGFLADATTKADVNRITQWMMSELSVGHHRGGGGERLEAAKTVPGGLLGADYTVENGRYRFRKIYGGLNWTPGLRAPLTEPGVDVKEGDYLLAVRGIDVRPPNDVFSYFENTSGRITEITVGPNADGSRSRAMTVVPIASEFALRNRAWVEGNIRKVDSLSNGRVAYVYVPNTAQPGYDYFKRYFYPQAQKDGIVVDERDNGGGSIADYYIDILRRPLISYWAMRYGADLRTPAASIQGPKALIVNEVAGSGGDLFPWMWRKANLGPIVGKRTWGGLVGILGFPTLMDGGTITAPNLAIFTEDGGWIVENEGVAPDIEVEQTPAEVMAGRDPQLEKAVEVVLSELKRNPPKPVVRPAYPIKK
ncbi:MAG: PDZ domain-containing protein [Longimicrobiales bacterium]